MAARAINLNLIPLLQALLNEESVIGAARKTNLSQPALSGALARLRDMLDDPLLVRSGRSMYLTPRAEELRGQVNKLCADIDAVFEPTSFDPITAEQEFVIATPDYLAYLIGKELLPRLTREAPGVTVRFVDVPNDLPDKLQNSQIDLAVCGNFDTWPSLEFSSVFYDRVVITLANDHPLSKKKRVSRSELLDYPILGFRPSVEVVKDKLRVTTGIASLDIHPQLTVGQFMDAVLLAQQGHYIAAAPKSLIDALSKLIPLRQVTVSEEEPAIDTGIFWVKALGEAPAMHWMRLVLNECLTASQKRFNQKM